MPNRLIDETSPYLLQHAHNPVDWYPWGEEAFASSRAEDKPVLLSIGYSACHWCHVMERESFEDSETAGLMNQLFVSIKVDREERPDLDAIYMAAVQGMTGRGGWPMTVFLTPEGKPFFGGTYFPPNDRPGMPAFRRVLAQVAQTYREQRDQVALQAENVTRFIQEQAEPAPAADHLDSTILDSAFVSLSRQFDPINGGFGSAPKFPQAMALDFLLRYHRRSGNPHALQMVELSLNEMARGGIYDHVGGGFHRYSVDDRWLVPHFEKMLYDNALLGRVYLHAFQITGSERYREVLEGTLEHLARDMRVSGGGFASTLDADSEGEEGVYYVWTPEQLEAVLGKPEAEVVARYFGVTPPGNFEGKTILTRPARPEEVAQAAGLTSDELAARIEAARPRLLGARQQRVAPDRDEKVLCSWNSLALRTFAEAYRGLGRQEYRAVAEETAAFLLDRLWQGDRLHRVAKDGRTRGPGYLEDYAALADALLALYEATFDLRWFRAAGELASALVDLFWDQESQTFRDTARDAEPLVVRPRERWDNATPSGTSLACHALLRLWAFTNETKWETVARQALAREAFLMGEHASGLGNLLSALDFYLGPPVEVAVIGQLGAAPTAALLGPLQRSYLPNLVLAAAEPDDAEAQRTVPLLADRGLADGQPAAYLCRGFVCELPTTDPAVLRAQLGLGD